MFFGTVKFGDEFLYFLGDVLVFLRGCEEGYVGVLEVFIVGEVQCFGWLWLGVGFSVRPVCVVCYVNWFEKMCWGVVPFCLKVFALEMADF